MRKRLTFEDFVAKSSEKHKNKYIYYKNEFIDYSTITKITCPLHGDFYQTPSSHSNGRKCMECAHVTKSEKRKMSFEEFKEKANILHSDFYIYKKEDFNGIQNKMRISCRLHGDWFQTPAGHLTGRGCNKCGNIKRSNSMKLDFESYVLEANKIHNNKYEYQDFSDINFTQKIQIKCQIHGWFSQNKSLHLSGAGCKKCGNVLTGKFLTKNFNDFLEEAKKVHKDKYIYLEKDYVNCSTKMAITCKEHGIFFQKPAKHIRGQKCLKCEQVIHAVKKRKTIEDFIVKANKIHNNKYSYKHIVKELNEEYLIVADCPRHGEFTQNGTNHLNGRGCPKCGVTFSQWEDIIKQFLIKNNIEFQERNRSLINPLEVDFVIPSKKIAIEINGIYWHSELEGKKSNYHLNKLNKCNEKGYDLIQITDLDIKNNKKIVLNRLKNKLGLINRTIYARKCEIKQIENVLKNKFLNKYHLQGEDKSSIKLGLFYKNRLVSVMTFGKLRKALGQKSKDGSYELVRFCSIGNFNIVGGASKLLSFFNKKYLPQKIISYANRNWSNGNIYNKLGFQFLHNSKPNYWYFRRYECDGLFHRFGFRKSILNTKLENFNPNLSEWDNMKANGWNRIWDCGSSVYIYSNNGNYS